MKSSISEKIVKNTVWNTAGYIVSFLTTFFLTPYIIKHIGIEKYGIWCIVLALTGYFSLLDIGIGTSFTKYIAEFYAKKDFEMINKIVNTGFIFYVLLTITIIFLVGIFIKPIILILKVSDNLYYEASFTILLGVIVFGISSMFSPFGAIQSGLQRMDISNKIIITLTFLQILGTVFVLKSGYGLTGLMVITAIITIIGGIVNIIVASRLLPELRFFPTLYDRSVFKKLFTLGYKMQFSKFAGWLQGNLNKIFLAHFLQIGFVTYYTVAINLIMKIQSIPLLLTSAIMPAASELETNANYESLRILYSRSIKYMMLTILPLSTGSILFAPPFINLWLGTEFKISILTFQILIIAYLFSALTSPGYFILSGIGKPESAMWSAIIAVITNLVLSILLVIKIGYFGVVIGTFCSLVISAIYFLIRVHHIMRISFLETTVTILSKLFISCVFPYLIIYIVLKHIHRITWPVFIGTVFLYLLLFIIVIFLTDYLDDFDKKILAKIYSKL